eukprot:scaffold76235_cov44-Cyclotella_meneghiniana.AAC.3
MAIYDQFPHGIEPLHVRQWTAAVALAPPRQHIRTVCIQNRSSECAAAAVPMRRLLSTDGHGAARFREEIDCRWPWLKRQVDQPSGAGGWSNHGRRTTPRKLEGRLEKDERMVSKSPRMARTQIS